MGNDLTVSPAAWCSLSSSHSLSKTVQVLIVIILMTLVQVCSSMDTKNYLGRLVQKKKAEVDTLLRQHQELDDPLVMRMSYMASENTYNVTNSLKRPGNGPENLHTMSVLCDLKRKSPTVSEARNIVEFASAAKFADVLTLAEIDGFLVNTEELEYGGHPRDLKECVKATRLARPASPPACIAKDLIIHPVQVAKALEEGASGVLLIAAVVGKDLEPLLDACTIMGTEAVVEVHTPQELEYALSVGATIFLVNMWDRLTGKLHKDQAKGLASMMPMNALTIAAGSIGTVEEAAELAFYGFDSVVLGRRLADMPDIKDFIDGVHGVCGFPRGSHSGGGMKSVL